MQPCFHAAVKIATVFAGRPKGSSHAGSRRVYGDVGRPSLRTPGLPAPAAAVFPVSVWPAVSRRAGDGVRRFAVAGVAVPVRGGSVIFDPLTGRPAWLCRLGHAMVGRRYMDRVRAFGRAVAQ